MRNCLLVGMMALVGIAAAEEEIGRPPLIVGGRCATPPVIDGKPGDECWPMRSAIGPFVDIRDMALADEPTYASAVWDDSKLYIHFLCEESRMDRLAIKAKTRDADGLWEDDAVEVFIQAPRGREYLHWIVNAAGVVFDERCQSQGERDVDWNSGIEAKTSRSDNCWTAELALPWADIPGGPPKPGDTWRINFTREQQSGNEWSAWAITPGSFHQPDRFGYVRFEAEDPGVSVSPLRDIFMGEREASVAAWGRVGEMRATVTGTAEFVSFRKVGELNQYAVSYEIARSGPGRVGVEVSDGDRLIYRTAEVPFFIEPVDTRLANLVTTATLWRLRVRSDEWPEYALPLREQGQEALSLLDGVVKRSGAFVEGTGTQEEWQQLGRDVDDLAARFARIDRIHDTWRAVGGDELPDFGTTIAPSTVKVLRDVPLDQRPSRTATLRLCRNEYEALQIVIMPLMKDLEDIEITWTDLTGPNGASISSELLEVNRVGYVKTRKPRYKVDYVGWYPDPLMPLDEFDAKMGQNQPIWVGVKTPADIPAGWYTGSITITPRNAQPQTVILYVEVWDITLPETTTLKTAISSWHTTLASWYGLKETPPELKRRYFDFLLDRRINPGTIYSGKPYWEEEDIRYCVDRGMNAFAVKYQGDLGGKTPEERAQKDQELATWAREFAEFLRKNGWIDKGYVYGFDEVRPDRYEQVVRAYKIIKEAAPDLRTACTVVPNATLNPVMDIWVPLTPHLGERGIWRHVGEGDEMWWYVCCGPTHPHANWFIDYSSLEHRLLFWQTHRYKVTGFLYYAMQMWRSNQVTKTGPSYVVPHDDEEVLKQMAAGKRWPEVPWNTFTYDHTNGDGHLFYPGPDQTLISCQRLENIRDGIEDYELLHELEVATDRLENVAGDAYRKLIGECRSLLGWRPHLFRDLTHYTNAPAVLEAERVRVARQLMRVHRVLEKLGEQG